MVEFRVETGGTRPAGPPSSSDQEYVLGKLCLLYQSAAYLTSGGVTAPPCAYLPLIVAHKSARRRLSTGATVHRWPQAGQAEVAERLRSARARWETDSACHRLHSIFEEHASAVLRDARKIVAFSCSTMSSSKENNGRSAFQHAFALSIRDFVCSARGEPGSVRCYAQDPVYTAADEGVLEEAGITVLDDPRGFLEVDGASIVISIASDVPVREIITDISRPAMLIWNTVPDEVDNNQAYVTDPVTPRVQRMVQSEYFRVELPHTDQSDSLNGVSLYVRKVAVNSSL
ncbi:hypothetical protein GQ53DRAFT_838062 [Thozetella sp. PMI_491]|nr:hypothetical protein GQ53DRAFT_838062 [Thozetella sp. PMI_491]